jgi:hypothetical protein
MDIQHYAIVCRRADGTYVAMRDLGCITTERAISVHNEMVAHRNKFWRARDQSILQLVVISDPVVETRVAGPKAEAA